MRTTIFNVGDYIGDFYDACWKVESVTEKEYAIISADGSIKRTVSREKNPSKYRQHEEDYAEGYQLLRPCGHEDITDFPVGSEWKCTDKSGLNDPRKDTVAIVHYAYSEGCFWVCNTRLRSMLFLADRQDLKPLSKRRGT